MVKFIKCISWILAVFAILALVCWTVPYLIYGSDVIVFNKHYVVTKENGQSVLQFHLDAKMLNYQSATNSSSEKLFLSVAAPELEFSSFSEMKSRIQKGEFTKGELGQIARFYRDETGKVEVLDLDRLHEPVFPASFGLNLSYLSWTGSSFSAVYLGDNSKVYASISKWSKDGFCKEVERLFKDHPQALKDVDPSVRILDVAAGVYKDSVVVRYSNNMRTWKTFLYMISDGQKTMHVMETFDVRISETIPDSIEIFYEQEDQFLRIFVASPNARPTYEEIASISIRKVK